VLTDCGFNDRLKQGAVRKINNKTNIIIIIFSVDDDDVVKISSL
jgi:hypothetical protein